MDRPFSLKPLVALILCVALIPQMVSCGTILYPERQNARHSGQIDIAVALMDGIGLLFFIIPGVVAFAVDFHTGAIYLPKGHPNIRKSEQSPTEPHPIQIKKIYPERLSTEVISSLVTQETGYPVRLDDSPLIVRKGEGGENVEAQLKRILVLNEKSGRILEKNWKFLKEGRN